MFSKGLVVFTRLFSMYIGPSVYRLLFHVLWFPLCIGLFPIYFGFFVAFIGLFSMYTGPFSIYIGYFSMFTGFLCV